MANLIIQLPRGGLAVVHHDPIANTYSAVAHDGARVSYPATTYEALTLLAMVAAPDERDLETLRRVYQVTEAIVHPRPYQRSRVGESVLDDYHEQGGEVSWPSLRAFARIDWESAKGDYTWPEYWAAITDEVLRRGLAGGRP